MNTNDRQRDVEKRVRATYHYRIHLERVCFNALLTYTEYRRRKNLHKSTDMKFIRSSISLV